MSRCIKFLHSNQFLLRMKKGQRNFNTLDQKFIKACSVNFRLYKRVKYKNYFYCVVRYTLQVKKRILLLLSNIYPPRCVEEALALLQQIHKSHANDSTKTFALHNEKQKVPLSRCNFYELFVKIIFWDSVSNSFLYINFQINDALTI